MSDQIDDVIRRRRTAKVLREVKDNRPLPSALAGELRTAVAEMLEVAAWAPFHYPAHAEVHRKGSLKSAVPWRFYLLEKPACDRLIQHLEDQARESRAEQKWIEAWNSKIPKLLAGAGALVQATWLPEPAEEGPPVLSDRNMEHIAAAAAAVQNFLLAGEARRYSTYWSSGGILRDPEIFEYLGIPPTQRLLGSIFISPAAQENVDIRPGAMRDKRGEVADWSTWVRAE